MVLALLAFVWMYWQTHRQPPPKPELQPARDVQIVHLPKVGDGGWAAMDEALKAAVRQAWGDGGPGSTPPGPPDAGAPAPGDAQ
jgi:hypothetical protein